MAAVWSSTQVVCFYNLICFPKIKSCLRVAYIKGHLIVCAAYRITVNVRIVHRVVTNFKSCIQGSRKFESSRSCVRYLYNWTSCVQGCRRCPVAMLQRPRPAGQKAAADPEDDPGRGDRDVGKGEQKVLWPGEGQRQLSHHQDARALPADAPRLHTGQLVPGVVQQNRSNWYVFLIRRLSTKNCSFWYSLCLSNRWLYLSSYLIVAGPYVLGGGLVVFLLSKEIWIIEHGFSHFVAFWALFWLITKKYGHKIGEFLDKEGEVSMSLVLEIIRPLGIISWSSPPPSCTTISQLTIWLVVHMHMP